MRKVVKVKCHVAKEEEKLLDKIHNFLTTATKNMNEYHENQRAQKDEIVEKAKGYLKNNDVAGLKELVKSDITEKIDDNAEPSSTGTDYVGWVHDLDSGDVIDSDGHRHPATSAEYYEFLQYIWHRANDKYLRGTPYEGWYHSDHTDSVISPSGKVYSQADEEYWDMLKVYNIRKSHMGG